MFLPVPGYEGLYEFEYETNTVRSLDRIIDHPIKNKVRLEGKNMAGWNHKYGHIKYRLCYKGIHKGIYIHQIVAKYFHGECPEGMEVCHNDGNPKNNYPDNLRYDTRINNAIDRTMHGRSNSERRGQKSHLSKVILQYSLDGVLLFRHIGIADTARKLGISKEGIYGCCLGRYKTSNGFIWKYE